MMRQNYYGQVPAENLLDRMAVFTDRNLRVTDETERGIF